MLKKYLTIFFLCVMLVQLTLAQTQNDTINIKSSSSFQEKTSSIVEKEITLPQPFNFLIDQLFNLKGQNPSLSLLVIMICIWVVLLLVITNVLGSMPWFTPATKWIAGVCITLIIGISGVILTTASFFLDIGSGFAFFQNWSAGALLVIVILLVVLLIVFRKIMNIVKEQIALEGARQKGLERAVNDAFVTAQREGLSK